MLLDSQFENTPRHMCDSNFLPSAGLSYWKIGTRQMCMKWLLIIRHVNSVEQCQTVSNSVNSVNSVNSYSAVLPPSPMVFFHINVVNRSNFRFLWKILSKDNVELSQTCLEDSSSFRLGECSLLWAVGSCIENVFLLEIHERKYTIQRLVCKWGIK